MLLLFIISITETDISFIRVNNYTEAKRDPASWAFPNYNIIYSIQDFIALIPKISQTKWIFISSESTAISPRYVSYILNTQKKSKNLLFGRFGCIPTNFINDSYIKKFKLCYRFPILESGFAFTSDLLQTNQFINLIKEIENEIKADNLNISYEDEFSDRKIHLSSLKFEYLIGLATLEANAIDDFRFSYFASNSSFRNSLFLASFNPSSSSNLDVAFLHASGIRFKEKISPFAEGEIVLGSGLNFEGKLIPFDDRISISCFQYNFSSIIKKKFNESFIVYPPYHYSDRFNVQVSCF